MDTQLINFDQILGQDSAIEAIRRAYRLNRLPHGLIFAGPAGVGKETTARALAALFLCEQPRELAFCGTCPSCRLVAAETHPDFHLVYRQLIRMSREEHKAKELSVDVVRPFLISKAANKSVMGVGKVFVVRESETMTASAQNALLKVLEEPPGRTLIILLTDQPDSLLPTVRSRCQLIRFAPLEGNVIVRLLAARGVSREQAQAASQFTQGSVGLALQWLEDGVIERARQLTGMLEALVAGGSAAGLQQWLRAAAEEYAVKQLSRDELASKDQLTREGVVLYLTLCAQYFDRRLGQLHGQSDALERCCAAIDAALAAERLVEANVNVPLCMQQFAGALEAAVGAVE
ncbi:DNA polymerase III subunit delta' [Fontivita pretiosa]|uniref:DNA polymerase III subunit delta' n=1 Tax=Fontivita pretiosa TaxID=2989684 RepID=UPI003D16B73D